MPLSTIRPDFRKSVQSAERAVDSLWLIMEAVQPWANCRRFRKTCFSAEGPIPGASEGPGQGDLLPLPYGEFHAALELMAVQGVIAIFQRASDAVSAGAFFGMDDDVGWRSPNRCYPG